MDQATEYQSLHLPETFLSSPLLISSNNTNDSAVSNYKFQLNTKTLALTYPDWRIAGFDTNNLLQRVRMELAEYEPQYIIAAMETHKSGQPHYHLGIRLNKQLRTRNSRFLDISGQHPNVQSTRSWIAWVRYCKKEGNWQEWGVDPTARRTSAHCKEFISSESIIEKAKIMNKLEFMAWMSSMKLTYAPMIWDSAHRDATITLTQEQVIQGILNPKFEKLITEVNWVEEKCLILIGDSGIGKTTYAKRIIPKPALFISHIDDLKKFEPDYHKSILFDDVCFTHYPLQAQIHLVDNENPRSIHIRYGTARIPQGTYKIFTCNEQPVDLSKAPIRRRCQVIRCDVVALQNF